MNTPAVTRVDECTNADTGVGAAIAAGSHLENGICALLVIAASRIPNHCIINILLFIVVLYRIVHCPILSVAEIAKSKNTSPSRLIIIVSIPALNDRWLL